MIVHMQMEEDCMEGTVDRIWKPRTSDMLMMRTKANEDGMESTVNQIWKPRTTSDMLMMPMQVEEDCIESTLNRIWKPRTASDMLMMHTQVEELDSRHREVDQLGSDRRLQEGRIQRLQTEVDDFQAQVLIFRRRSDEHTY